MCQPKLTGRVLPEEKCLVREAAEKCKCKNCEQTRALTTLTIDLYCRMIAAEVWWDIQKEKKK